MPRDDLQKHGKQVFRLAHMEDRRLCRLWHLVSQGCPPAERDGCWQADRTTYLCAWHDWRANEVCRQVQGRSMNPRVSTGSRPVGDAA